MAREFSFEEAMAPPTKESAPKEFSFEEAIGAKPKEAPKKATEPEAEQSLGSPMGTGLEETLAVAKPKKRSVLEGMDMPAPAATEDKYVVNPQFTNAVQARLNSMPEEKRGAVLEKMIGRTDVYGRAARAIAGRYEAADKSVSPTMSKLTDLRLELQTQRFIDQGVDPEVAKGIAESQALSGRVRPDLDQIRETPKEVQAGLDLAYNPKLHGIDATVQELKRVGVKTTVALGQAGGGMQIFAGDLLGLDTSDKRNTLKKLDSFVQAMGEPSLKPLAILENAVTSIGQQLPAMVFGTLTGSEPLVLASMFANSFGQNYEEGRRNKLDFADSTARAAANASLEVLGEKFGLKQNINAIKTAMKGVPTDQLANFIAITLKKDVPGELLTYAGQYAVDMGYGMKPEASIQNFVQGAIDTMLTTVAQGGIMAGGRKVISAVASKGNAESTSEPEVAKPETVQSAEDLAKSKGFLVSTPTKPKASNEFSFEEATAPKAETAAPAERVKVISERLQAQGISQRVANAIAEKEVAADELAQAETGEPTNVAEPIKEPVGASADVAEQPDTGLTPGGVAEPDARGVVPAGQDVASADVGEGVKPAALTETPPTETKPTLEEQIKADEERQAAYDVKKAKVESIARLNASAAFDQAGDYTNLQEAIDSYEINMGDTLVEEGFKNDPDYDALVRTASRAFDDEISKLKGTTTDGTTPTETIKAEEKRQEEQPPPAAGAVVPGKRLGRPPVQQRHTFSENTAGGFDHVTDNEVTATYANKKQATAAVNLAKAKDKGDAALIATNQAKLDAALASKGKGRPPKPPAVDGTVELDGETRQEMEALESALKTYNLPASGNSVANAAMYISDAAVDPTVPKAVRERAQQMLKDDVSTKDIPKKIKSTDGNVGKGDTGFNSAANGAQAITRVIKTGNAFQRFVAERIRNFLSGVKFVVLEKGDTIPDGMEDARGLFVYDPKTKERTVYVRGASFGGMQGINNITVLHEMLHAATTNRITAGLLKGFRNAQLQKFVREMSDIMKRAEQEYKSSTYLDMVDEGVNEVVSRTYDPKTDSYDIFTSPYEFLAYGMSSPEFQKFLMGVKGVRKEPTLFSAFANSIRDLFGIKQGESTAFSDLVDITDKMLGTRVTPTTAQSKISLQEKAPLTDEEKQKELDRAVAQATKKVATSRDGYELGNAVADLAKWRDPRYLWGEIKGVYDAATNPVRSAISNFYDSEALAYAGPGDIITGLKDAHEAIQKMASSTQTYMRGVADLSLDVAKFFRGHPELRQPFEDLINATTLAKYDPSDKKATIRSKQLDADYEALGKEGQKTYQQARDYYKAMNAVKQQLLEENLEKLDLDPEARKKLLADVRLIFEQDKIEPYFPLARFGDFVLEVGAGKSRASYRFETMKQRDRAAREYAAKRGKTIDELRQDEELKTSEDSSGSTLRSTIEGTSKLLKATYDAIESANMADSQAKQNLKDTLYQAYLAAMPENSVRKMFMHRKGTPGFSSDILRTINTTGLKMSSALAKLEHSGDIRRALELANRELNRGNDKYKPFVKRMEELAADAIQPKIQTDAARWFDTGIGFLAKISFLKNLTSWSSAMLQPVDIIMVGAPVLTGNHGPKAAVALANRLNLVSQYGIVETRPDGSKRYRAPSIEYAKGITPLQRQALRDMVDVYGVTKNTLSNEVFSRAGKPTAKVNGKAYGLGKNAVDTLILGGLMHHGERLSREVMALTSFDLYMAELEKARPKDPMNFHEAVKLAVRETHEALGNYDPSNRPLIMRGGIGKLVTMYKFFPLVRTKLLGINFFKMLPLFNKEGKKAAATKFFGILGTHLLLGGYTALPMFSLALSVLGYIWKKWQKDPDAPDDMRSVKYETWFRTEYLPNEIGRLKAKYEFLPKESARLAEYGLLNYFTGMNVSGRITMNDMWFRDPQPGNTIKETFLNWGQVLGGPVASNILATAEGFQLMSQGEWERGLEKAIPLGSIAKLLTAKRYAEEGVQTSQGVQLVPKGKVPTSELVGQAIGFTPARIAEAQDKAFAATVAEKDLAVERTKIVHTLVDSFRKSIDPSRPLDQNERFDKIFNEALLKMVDFNIRNPNRPIEDEEVGSLINATMKKIAETEMGSGVRVTNKNLELVTPSSDAALEALTPYLKEKNPR